MRTLGGRYWLDRPLGQGGMAVVWRGYDRVLRRSVAVKLLAPDRVAEQSSRERIRAEAYAAAQLAHPNVANVYDFGESRWDSRSRVPYLVMELVQGETLAERLSRGPVSHWRTAVRICAEVAAALAAAHARGVVHRDVKPGNIMLASTGVKVVDFGIAEAIGDAEADSGRVLLGTPSYIAPERLRGEAVVPATDVYALGLLLYHCLTGVLPWPASTPAEIISAHRDLPPAPLPNIDGLPDEVSELYERCLAKDPAERPTSLLAALILAEAVGAQVTLPSVDTPAATVKPPPTIDPVNVLTTFGLSGDAAPGRHAAVAAGGRIARSTAVVPLRPVVGTTEAALKRTDEYPNPRPVTRPTGLRRLRRAATLGVAGAAATLVALIVIPLLTTSSSPNVLMPGAAAEPAPVPSVAAGACAADYQARHRGAGTFRADLTIVNRGPAALGAWSLRFTFPSGQRLTGAQGAGWTQVGSAVTLRGQAPLAAGQATRLVLSGRYTGRLATPTGFSLDGVECGRSSGGPGSSRTPGFDQVNGGAGADGGPAATTGDPTAPAATGGGGPTGNGPSTPATPTDPGTTDATPTDATPTDPTPTEPATGSVPGTPPTLGTRSTSGTTAPAQPSGG